MKEGDYIIKLNLDDNKIIELYKTKSGFEISKIFGVDHSTIYRRLKKHNIKLRGCREARILGGKKYKNLDIDKIISLYESGKSRLELGRLFGVHENVIKDRLKSNNIPLRSRKEAFAFINQTGEKSSNWNGGRFKNSSGYIKIHKPEHPKSSYNYVYEHHLVWEKENEKLLPDGWVIHHINGIKDDNRIENLIAMEKSDHSCVLKSIKKRIVYLENENKRLKEKLKKYKREMIPYEFNCFNENTDAGCSGIGRN